MRIIKKRYVYIYIFLSVILSHYATIERKIFILIMTDSDGQRIKNKVLPGPKKENEILPTLIYRH